VQEVFQAKCTHCHGETRRENGLRLDRWEELRKGSSFGAVVYDGSTEWSHLLWHLNHFGPQQGYTTTDLMPYRDLGNGQFATDTANLLSLSEYSTLVNWVAAGAPNCEGTRLWQHRTTTGSGKFFWLNSGSDNVGVLDVQTNLTMTYFPVGQSPAAESPHYVSTSPDGQRLYVSLISASAGYIESYRTSDYTLLARSPRLGSGIAHVEPSADGRFLMVTNWVQGTAFPNEGKLFVLEANTLAVIDSATDSYLNFIHGLCIAPDFSVAYATSNAGNYFLKVSLNPSTGEIVALAPTTLDGLAVSPNAQQAPYQCVLSPDGTRLFLTSQGENGVYLYDVSGVVPQQLAFIQSGGEPCVQGIGLTPKLLKYHQGRLYIVCWAQLCPTSANRERKGCISVVRVEGNTLVWERNIYGLGQEPRGLAIDATRQRLYVCSSGNGNPESPHHSIPGQSQPIGSVNWVDISDPTNPRVARALPLDAAFFPTGAALVP
jgi:DNA-binding beta-propeller fold protein YncE